MRQNNSGGVTFRCTPQAYWFAIFIFSGRSFGHCAMHRTAHPAVTVAQSGGRGQTRRSSRRFGMTSRKRPLSLGTQARRTRRERSRCRQRHEGPDIHMSTSVATGEFTKKRRLVCRCSMAGIRISDTRRNGVHVAHTSFIFRLRTITAIATESACRPAASASTVRKRTLAGAARHQPPGRRPFPVHTRAPYAP